jgi:hypothetical protein
MSVEPFTRVSSEIEVRFPPALAAFLADVPVALSSIRGDPEDPASARLHVPVYLDDREADDEYWQLMAGELDRERAADRSLFARVTEEAVDGVRISVEDAYAYLRVLVEARLVLAARMGVDVEDDYEDLEPSQAGVLDALAELQVLLLRALGP